MHITTHEDAAGWATPRRNIALASAPANTSPANDAQGNSSTVPTTTKVANGTGADGWTAAAMGGFAAAVLLVVGIVAAIAARCHCLRTQSNQRVLDDLQVHRHAADVQPNPAYDPYIRGAASASDTALVRGSAVGAGDFDRDGYAADFTGAGGGAPVYAQPIYDGYLTVAGGLERTSNVDEAGVYNSTLTTPTTGNHYAESSA